MEDPSRQNFLAYLLSVNNLLRFPRFSLVLIPWTYLGFISFILDKDVRAFSFFNAVLVSIFIMVSLWIFYKRKKTKMNGESIRRFTALRRFLKPNKFKVALTLLILFIGFALDNSTLYYILSPFIPFGGFLTEFLSYSTKESIALVYDFVFFFPSFYLAQSFFAANPGFIPRLMANYGLFGYWGITYLLFVVYPYIASSFIYSVVKKVQGFWNS